MELNQDHKDNKMELNHNHKDNKDQITQLNNKIIMEANLHKEELKKIPQENHQKIINSNQLEMPPHNFQIVMVFKLVLIYHKFLIILQLLIFLYKVSKN